MAIIKCPECGHQISDKAPICPNCGVEIAGKIAKCPQCGEIYLKSETVCPHCQNNIEKSKHENTGTTKGTNIPSEENNVTANAVTTEQHNGRPHDNRPKEPQKNKKTVLIVSVVIAVLILGTCMYFYKNANNNREQEEYEIALNSDDPMILQMYLDNFKDAPTAHRDTIMSHLQSLRQADQEWENTIASGSKTALEEYLAAHPDSPHKQEAEAKIDSIDWEQCVKANTPEAYQEYIDAHSDGNHYEEAVIALKKIKSSEVNSDEKLAIRNVFRNFFISINTKNESGLTVDIGEHITFLGKQDATKEDIVSFMHKLYKEDVENMVWSIPGNYDIKKKEIGNEQYECNVVFMAEQKVRKTDGTESINKYRINGKVDPDMKITELSMTKINE